MSGVPRPKGLHQVQNTNRVDQDTEANALVKAFILVAEVLEEGGHSPQLVGRAREVVRKAAAGERSCDLRLVVRRSADGGYIGTCQSMAMR